MTIPAISLRVLPLWAAVVPLVTVNVCYLIAVDVGHVPECIPYLSGCTSVSSTGRMAPESLIFRAGMLPTALILALFWQGCTTFLELGGQSGTRLVTLRALGVVAALSLTIYALTLGFEENAYRQMRRIGIIGFALSTFFAELSFIFLYRRMRTAETERLWRWLIALCVALPLLSITAEVAKWAGAPKHGADNTVAWNAFVAASTYYAVVARVWWHHGFTGEFRLSS
jgi:heme/copper-type cytochrome/quinol oxidase subunit 4